MPTRTDLLALPTADLRRLADAALLAACLRHRLPLVTSGAMSRAAMAQAVLTAQLWAGYAAT